jgi:probable rRNA maturation factor
MKLIFNFQNKTKVRQSKNFFAKIAKEVLKKEKIKGECELGLIIVGARTIKKLNKKYRGIDKVTDVLSFPLDIIHRSSSIVHRPRFAIHRYLGDIVICYPQAVRQAKEQKHSIKKELEFLFKHGLMHLLSDR